MTAAAKFGIEFAKGVALLNHKIREYQLEQVWNRFESAGFKPLLIKGWAAAARNYAEPSERLFTDIDLVFSSAEFERAERFLESLEGEDGN